MVENAGENYDQQNGNGSEGKKWVYGFSGLRVYACLAVIILHTVYSAVLLFGNTLSQAEYTASMAVVDCMMWAVPCFIMVTGALLLDREKKITYKKLFGQYIFRIFAALVLFGMVFRIFDIFMDGETVSIAAFLQGFYEIFTGTGWSHIWYLYLLIGLYLLLPFYKKIADNSSGNELKYLLGIYVLFLSLLPVLQIWNINSGFYIHVSTIYPFYLFCGYAVCSHILRPGKRTSVLLLLAGTAAIAGCTIVRWIYDLPEMERLWGYSSVFVIIQAVGIFSLVHSQKECRSRAFKRILLELDKCSFGVYLIHMILVRLILRYMQFNPYENGGILAFAGLIAGIFAVSFLITWILRKIPFLRKII